MECPSYMASGTLQMSSCANDNMSMTDMQAMLELHAGMR